MAKKTVEKTKSKGGRPLKFATPELMQIAIDSYELECMGNTREVYSAKQQDVIEMSAPIPLTVEGLAVCLDMDRRSILNYEKKDEFFPIIKRIKDKILKNQVEMALTGESDKVMTIFMLKNNQGYADKTEVHQTGEGLVTKLEVEYVPKSS